MDRREHGWRARARFLLVAALSAGCAGCSSPRLSFQGRVAESEEWLFALQFHVEGCGEDVLWLRLHHGDKELRTRSIGPDDLRQGVTLDVVAKTFFEHGQPGMRLVVVATGKWSSTASTLFDETFPGLRLAGKSFCPSKVIPGSERLQGGELFQLTAFAPDGAYESVTCGWWTKPALSGEKAAPAG